MTNEKNILIVQNRAILVDKETNFKNVARLIAPHKGKEIDFLVLPEVWSVGWAPLKFQECAELLDNSETLEFLSRIATEYNTNILGGSFITKDENGFYNTCVVLDRSGKLVTTYNKMHLFKYDDFNEEKYVSPGVSAKLLDIEGIRLGLTICYDIRFPEIFRAYAYKGVHLLVNMAAWPKQRLNHWQTLQKARAIENQAFVVAVSQTGLIEEPNYCLGHSMAINPLGEVITELDDREIAKLVKINLNEVDDFKKLRPIINDRHTTPYNVTEVIV